MEYKLIHVLNQRCDLASQLCLLSLFLVETSQMTYLVGKKLVILLFKCGVGKKKVIKSRFKPPKKFREKFCPHPRKFGRSLYLNFKLVYSPIRMCKKYTRVNILLCVFILRCANQPESKFKLRSHGVLSPGVFL